MGISEQDFAFISDMILKESAIVLGKGKEYLVESRLGPLATEEGLGDISDLVRKLQSGGPILVLKKKVVEALTTNETSFFRDLSPFEVFRKHLLPEVMKRNASTKRLRIWCAAVSSGQEIYSIAMTLRDHFPELASWNVQLLGTDLSNQVLEKARNGEYTQFEVNRGLPATCLVKYFTKEGLNWKVKDELRSMLELRELNLIKPWGMENEFDIVFIRNVLIYFDTEVKRQILERVAKSLRPKGYMFLGAAETTLNITDAFSRCSFDEGSCYQLEG